jgi:UDP-N-acetylglucosamine diphosphorylase/glucosamine-1-phosphate N-acetyltransferase
VIIMAAGKGTRMVSDLPKVLHVVGGKPLVEHVIAAARQLGPDLIVVIVGHGRDQVVNLLNGQGLEFAVQDPPLGTGHAVLQARPALQEFRGEVVILSGDVPLLRAGTLRRLVEAHRDAHVALTVLSTAAPDPFGYGRIVRSDDGEFLGIVEHKEASEAQKAITEINSGIYCCDSVQLFRALDNVRADNSKGEYYLTDIVAILRDSGQRVQAVKLAEYREICGINTPAELAAAEGYYLEQRGG